VPSLCAGGAGCPYPLMLALLALVIIVSVHITPMRYQFSPITVNFLVSIHEKVCQVDAS
jgi:hypothetical protein